MDTDPSPQETREREYHELLQSDPGNEAFIEFGEFLRRSARYSDALLVVLRGVSTNPTHPRGRLLLARVLFDCGCTSLAAREVEVLCRQFPEGKFLKKLLERLAPQAAAALSAKPREQETQSSAPETLAEADIDFDVLDSSKE